MGALRLAALDDYSQRFAALGRYTDRMQAVAISDDLVAAAGKLLFQVDPRSPFLRFGEPLLLLNTEDPAAAAGPAEAILYVEATR